MNRRRRRFVQQLGAGGLVIGAPAFLAGCSVAPAIDTNVTTPVNPFLAWFGIDESMLVRVMSELTAKGATHADLYFQHRRTHRLRYEQGRVQDPDIAIEQGVGLHVIVAGQSGFAATEDLTLQGMLLAAREASAMAAGAPPAPNSGFQIAPQRSFYPVTTDWSDTALAQRVPILERTATSARAADPAVKEVVIDWEDVDERVLIATVDGQLHTDRRPLTRLSAQVEVRRDAGMHSGFASQSARQDIHWYDEARIAAIAATAVERALVRFDARRPPPVKLPVILAAGSSGIVLHEALGHALEADFGASGAGTYAGQLGAQVASPLITIIDDATLRHARGALNVDDEGVPGQRNVLIERGTLRTYLHDRRSAHAAGVAPTGTGRRESFRHPPMPRMSATFIANGNTPPEELLAGVRRGILAETYSHGRVDPASGDFSFQIDNGWYIERGKAVYPVRDVTLSGNGPQMLRNVQELANDGRMDEAGWTCGKRGQRVPVSHGMPTALVTGLRVST